MDPGLILTQGQYDIIAKGFRSADSEESGVVDKSAVPGLAGKVIGASIKETDLDIIRFKAETKAGTDGTLTFADFLELMSEVMGQTTRWGNLGTKLDGYVGFDTVQEQIRKKSLKRGFEFNTIVVGESGLGKSTLINTLFKARISRSTCTPPQDDIPKTTQVNSVSHVIEEQGVRLKLTVTDTPGFGDQINNDQCWVPVLEFVHDQFEKYLNEEVSIDRKKSIPDSRIHACIYFIPPTGHYLRPIDVEFMQRMHNCVNIIPVIGKADTLTVEEREAFKARIREDLRFHGIKIYPSAYGAEDDEDAAANAKIEQLIPFAVIGSDREVAVGGKKVYGRQTKWGFIEVENKKHCEFSQLRDMLIRTHMQDLKEMTDKVHYENFRRDRLQTGGGGAGAVAGESNI